MADGVHGRAGGVCACGGSYGRVGFSAVGLFVGWVVEFVGGCFRRVGRGFVPKSSTITAIRYLSLCKGWSSLTFGMKPHTSFRSVQHGSHGRGAV